MDAFKPKLATDDYLSLMDALFALLAYYEDRSQQSIPDVSLTPFMLQVLCDKVQEKVLMQCPLVIRQAFEYIGCVSLFEHRKLIMITFLAKLFALNDFVSFMKMNFDVFGRSNQQKPSIQCWLENLNS